MRRLRLLLVFSSGALLVLSVVYLIAARTFAAVDIADEGLEAAVRDAAGEEVTFLSASILERMVELDASGRGIERLEGIEQLPNLRSLDLQGNHVEDVSPLNELQRLQTLDLRDNGIVDPADIGLGSLASMPELSVLDLSGNREPVHPETPEEHRRISDLTVLRDFDGIEELYLSDNHIEDLSPLASLERLRRLDLRNNRLQDEGLSPLSSLPQLEHLNVRDNYLRSISALSEMISLRYLNIHSNDGIESIVPLRTLSNLETLIVRGVPIGDDVQVLSELRSLRRLNVRSTGIRDLTPIAELMEAGALQDIPEEGVHAAVDIRENPVSDASGDPAAGYRPLAEYWENVSRREPWELPQ